MRRFVTPDQYLFLVLSNRRPTQDSWPRAARARSAFVPIIRRWMGHFVRSIGISGSLVKKTAVAGSNDTDLFISLAHSTPYTLRELYYGLHGYLLKLGFSPVLQDVSLRVKAAGLSIDLVPAKRQPESTAYHSLYRRKLDTRIQTNVNLHIQFVRDSGRISEIRAVKLWRDCHKLELSSFLVELAVIESLYGRPRQRLAENFILCLDFFAHSFLTTDLIDPANGSNIVSDDISSADKIMIRDTAKASLARGYVELMVW